MELKVGNDMKVGFITALAIWALALALWAIFGEARATSEADNETALKMYNRLVDACSMPEDYEVGQTAIARTAATNSLRIAELEKAVRKFIENPNNKP